MHSGARRVKSAMEKGTVPSPRTAAAGRVAAQGGHSSMRQPLPGIAGPARRSKSSMKSETMIMTVSLLTRDILGADPEGGDYVTLFAYLQAA